MDPRPKTIMLIETKELKRRPCDIKLSPDEWPFTGFFNVFFDNFLIKTVFSVLYSNDNFIENCLLFLKCYSALWHYDISRCL